MVFRVASKSFSLTYPQSNTLNKEELLEHLKKEKNLKYVCVSEEQHQDGNKHFHVHLLYDKRKDIKNEKYFDYKERHPNIQATKDNDEWNKYIKKDNDFIEFGQFESSNLYERARTKSHEEYYEECRKEQIPFQYAKEAWDYSKKVDTTINEEDEIPGTFDGRLGWIDFSNPHKCTVIIGPTGMGKTVFAKTKAAKPALFVSHMDDLKSFDATRHKSIIFDDMCFKHIPTQGQIHLVDTFEPRSIHIRYGTVKIPAGIQKWFTCNEQPFSDHEAIRRRINQINFY